MCLVLDIVTNHIQPTSNAADVATVHPFNKTAYYHTYHARPGESFDSYARHPASSLSAFGPGCGPGDFKCAGGYNEAQMLDGWFYDLADLNQSHPYVRSELLRWVKHMVTTYSLDALRLDTAPYMPMNFLAELQQAAGVEIIGEVTASNLSYHASFTAPADQGGGGLDGVLNFPAYYQLGHAFCGAASVQGALVDGATEKVATVATADLRPLASVLELQRAAAYSSLDLLGVFADNHDVTRLASVCNSDLLRMEHALAFVILMRGVPIIYSGTEQALKGSTGGPLNGNRYSLWANQGYDTQARLYAHIKALNGVRRVHLMPLTRAGTLPDARVVSVTNETLVLARGAHPPRLLLFVNNKPTSERAKPVRYCLGELEGGLLAAGGWYDALSGQKIRPHKATSTDGCPAELPFVYRSLDGAPKAAVAGAASADALFSWHVGLGLGAAAFGACVAAAIWGCLFCGWQCTKSVVPRALAERLRVMRVGSPHKRKRLVEEELSAMGTATKSMAEALEDDE
jgi:glycosidase